MIVVYNGRRGSGKTLCMVKDAYRFQKRSYKLLANYHTTFCQYISNENILKLDLNSDLKHVVLLISELQILFDSRNFNTKGNKGFSYFVQQIRKRDIIILGDTQFTNTIDIRLRQNCDVLAFPEFNINISSCQYFDLTSMDNQMENCNNFIEYFDPKPYFNLYDTTEIVV